MVKEFDIVSGKKVELDKLKSKDFIPDNIFQEIHKNLVVFTSDVLVYYKNGFLLMKRTKKPLMGEYFFCGGRVQKGVPLKEFLRKKIKEECGLSVGSMVFLFASREFYEEDPFEHGKGTDTCGFKYLAIGKGEINLDKNHGSYIIIKPEEYPSMRSSLVPLVREAIDIAIKYLEKAKEENISFEECIKKYAEKD